MSVQFVILAAGQGKRMQSALPKVLHTLAGKSLLEHVITTSLTLSKEHPPIIIYGHQGELLRNRLSHYDVRWVEQKEQLGTAHAVMQALPLIAENSQVVVLYGDVPLISVETLQRLINTTPAKAIGLLTTHCEIPTGYGRIKRDQKENIIAIVEEKDASEKERELTEINPGIYLFPIDRLQNWLPRLNNDNNQHEYYLTEAIKLAVTEQVPIHSIFIQQCEEVLGVNDQKQLAQLERFYQRQYANQLMLQGVTMLDPNRLDIRGEVQIGREVTIDVNVILEGRVVIGNHCHIGPFTVLRNVVLGDNVEIKSHSVIDGAEIAANCIVGPFARLRPGTTLDTGVHVGNFVEVKNSQIGSGSKVNHLSYVGDSLVGKRVNIGAGTITCNYDGFNKHQTIIGDDTHIGSDTQLVAPVTVGNGATIGAGSTIIKDVPANQLTITHKIDQRSIKDWQRPGSEIKKSEKSTEC